MKCCILALLISLTCCTREKKQEPTKYLYKGKMITFEEWGAAIREKKRNFCEFKKPEQSIAPPDDIWLQVTNPQKFNHTETMPLLGRTRSFNSLNQFGSY